MRWRVIVAVKQSSLASSWGKSCAANKGKADPDAVKERLQELLQG